MIFRFTHPQIVLVSIIHGGLFQRTSVFYWLTIIIFFSGLYAFQRSINLILYFSPTKIIKRTIKNCVGCIYWILYPPNKQSIPYANPATKKFFKRLPTLGVFWLFTLHHSVSFKQRTNKMVVCRGIEPLLPEWKSSVLADRRTDR